LLWVHFSCSNGTLGRKKTTSPHPSATGPARACRATVRRAANRDIGWGVGSFARGAGSAKPAMASYDALYGTLPPASTRQVPKRAHTKGPKDASRATASGAGKGLSGGVRRFELGAGWAKPQTKCARRGRPPGSAGGCERVTILNLALRRVAVADMSALVDWRRSASVYRYNVF